METGATEGFLTTRPLVFNQGDRLFLNVNNPDGELRVEVLDVNDNVIAGFSRSHCEVVTQDSTCVAVRWQDDQSLKDLAGQAVRFRFYLKQGGLYAFWLSGKSGASRGYVAGGGPGYTSLVDNVSEVSSIGLTIKISQNTSPIMRNLQ